MNAASGSALSPTVLEIWIKRPLEGEFDLQFFIPYLMLFLDPLPFFTSYRM